MKYTPLVPPAGLSGLVNYFWVAEADGTQTAPYTYLSTADSCPKLVFPYPLDSSGACGSPVEKTFFTAALQGQTQEHGQFPTPGRFGMFGVSLRTYAIPGLFAVPTIELTNQLLDLETLLGSAGKELEEKMRLAKDNQERVGVLTSFFLDQLARHYRPQTDIAAAIDYIRRQKGQVNIGEVSSRYCLSQKQFERRFKALSGFMPKLFARIVRFETALTNHPACDSLTELAYGCGYYDQAHFIKEFREFSGHHPRSYFAALPPVD